MNKMQYVFEDKIANFIANNAGIDELDYDLKIFEEGLVNSLFAIELMTYIEKEFNIKIRIYDLDMQNFESVNIIASFIRKKEGIKNE